MSRSFIEGLARQEHEYQQNRLKPTSQLILPDQSSEAKKQERRLQLIDSRIFAETVYRQKYLVKGVLTAGQNCMLGGGSKTMKTTIAVDLALSIGTGTPFLGEFHVPEPATVAVLSGESGGFTLQETARRIAFAKGIELAEADVFWGFTLPRVSDLNDLLELRELVLEKGIKVFFVDPLYLVMLDESSAGQASNVLGMGPRLLRLNEALAGTDCTIVCLHHARKNKLSQFDPMQLEDLAMSGFAEWARQWLLLSRREEYEPGSGDHKLWLNIGGSAGHNGLYGLDVIEGSPDDYGGRKWVVDISSGTELRKNSGIDSRATKQAAAIKGRQGKIMEVLRNYPEGLTASAIARKAGVNHHQTEHALEGLKNEGLIIACQVTVSNQKTPKEGFKLPIINHCNTATGHCDTF